MTDAFDLTRQAHWEVEATRRAAERYREAASEVDPETLPGGKRLLRRLVAPLTATIATAQAEGRDALLKPGGGRAPVWAWPIQLLDAETLAVITAISAIRATLDDREMTGGITETSRRVSNAVRLEVEMRQWEKTQADTTAAARKAKTPHRDVLAAFRRAYPDVNERVWKRWRRRLEAEFRIPVWDTSVVLGFGAKLLSLLVEAAPEVFEKRTRNIGQGRTQLFLKLSEEAIAVTQDVEARAMVARPLRYPMLIEPNRWGYADGPD